MEGEAGVMGYDYSTEHGKASPKGPFQKHWRSPIFSPYTPPQLSGVIRREEATR